MIDARSATAFPLADSSPPARLLTASNGAAGGADAPAFSSSSADAKALALCALDALPARARNNRFASQALEAFNRGDFATCIEECVWAAERSWDLEHCARP